MASRVALPNESSAAAVLAGAGVPRDYPIRGCFFDERVQAFAENEGCGTLASLAVTPLAAQVLAREIDIPNFGGVSASAVRDFQEAVAVGDRARLQQYVPLSLERAGIDLGLAARRAATASGLAFEGLVARLVTGATLDEVGRLKNLTRERVRQIEEDFTDFLKTVLEGIPGERGRKWDEWERTGSVGAVLSAEPAEVVELVQGTLRHLFSRQPEAVAIRERQWQLAEEAAAALALVPAVHAGGVDARELTTRRFPGLRWHRLLEWNATHRKFVVRDDDSFRIAEPKARDVVAALLATGETKPREIIDFLLGVPDVWAWPHDSLANNCAAWRASGAFPKVALAGPEPDLTIRPRASAEVDARGLIDFVRQTGPRSLNSVTGTEFRVEAHRDGLVIVSGKGNGRRFDLQTLEGYAEAYAKTKSRKTTAYGGGFHSTYFISLVEAYERERPYSSGEIGPDDLEIILQAKPTERTALLQNRIGQGRFRDDLILNRKICYITGLADPRFLRASHIKPWRDCNDADRLDWHNGLLLTPNLDLLFDRGLISFQDNGALLISSQLPEGIRKDFGLQPGFRGAPLSEKTCAFLAEHRAKCFRQ